MWLLSIETRKLQYFEGRNVPEYAILSHRWTCDEVSFQDVLDGNAERKDGYAKIDNFCKQVETEGLSVTYVWIDTCCIDKTNNSELSEAINSMYKWYLQAKVCYAYLADVSHEDMAGFSKSVWFSRGWTLQELLAPDDVQFFDRDWIKLGTKLELSEFITQITGIPGDVLKHFDSRRSPHSIADRMSWAAQRQTTREEDLAYSLLGLFGVNMPLLYGEGPRAFLRLQEEILKISEDLTIFAWQRFPRLPTSNDYLRDTTCHDFGLFAASPESFDHRNMRFRNLLDSLPVSENNLLECSMSGAGLTVNLVLVPYCPDIYIAPLCDVFDAGNWQMSGNRRIAAMFLERNHSSKGRYRRINYNKQSLIVDTLDHLNIDMGRTQRVVLERTPFHAMGRPLRAKYGFNILHLENDLLRLFQISSQDKVDILKRKQSYHSLFMESGDIGVAGMIRLSRRNLPPIYFHFGFDFEFNPFCLISRPSHEDVRTKEHKIMYDSSIMHKIAVGCNAGILHLVSLLKADPRKLSLQQHNLELHVGSRKLKEMQFVGRDCRIGLDISAGHEEGYVYHVSIGLAHRDYPWATAPSSKRWSIVSKEEDFKWHSDPWDRQSLY